MLGLVSNDSIKAMVSYAEMYKAAKSPEHTMETLADLEKKVEVYVPTLVFFSFFLSLLLLSLFFSDRFPGRSCQCHTIFF